jgi:hypothetical protein
MIGKNDSGYALVTVVFILLTAITAALLPAGQLVQQTRVDTRQYVTDMKRQKMAEALFGRPAKQAGGEFMNCGGLVGDYNLGYGSTRVRMAPHVLTRRYLMTGTTTRQIRYADDFVYRPELGFWGGYRGKQYLYPGPADEWDTRLLGHFTNKGGIDPGITLSYRDGHGEPFSYFTGCQDWASLGSGEDGRNKIKPQTFFKYYFRVKDYTRRESLELQFVKVSRSGSSIAKVGVFDAVGLPDKSSLSSGYYTHTFVYNDGWGKIKMGGIGDHGLHKILIRGADGQTLYTTAVVVPAYVVTTSTKSDMGGYIDDIFVQTIEFRG